MTVAIRASHASHRPGRPASTVPRQRHARPSSLDARPVTERAWPLANASPRARIDLERGLVELELDRDRIVPGEACRAEIVRRAAGRAEEALEREIAERVR